MQKASVHNLWGTRKGLKKIIEMTKSLCCQSIGFTCSMWFIDVYACRLNGCGAAWAAQRYKGHHVFPESNLNELLDENIT